MDRGHLLPQFRWTPRRVRRNPDVARWQLIAWCLLMLLVVSIVSSATFFYLFLEATRPY